MVEARNRFHEFSPQNKKQPSGGRLSLFFFLVLSRAAFANISSTGAHQTFTRAKRELLKI